VLRRRQKHGFAGYADGVRALKNRGSRCVRRFSRVTLLVSAGVFRENARFA
jgi:hypothetical protein